MKKKCIPLFLAAMFALQCLGTVLAGGSGEVCSLDLTIDGVGTVEVYTAAGWQELAPESGSWNLPVGQEAQFRCLSAEGQLYTVLLNDVPLAFEAAENAGCWTFSFVPEDIWAGLFVVFEADDAVDIDLLIDGPGMLFYYQDGEWSQLAAGENAFSMDDTDAYTLFRAQPAREGCAALSITFGDTALTPSAFTREGTEFCFSMPESPGILALTFGPANLVVTPADETVRMEVQIGEDWIPASPEAEIPTGDNALLCRLLSDGTAVSSLLLNDVPLELSPIEEGEDMWLLFELPAQANGMLKVQEEAGGFLIETAGDAPEDLACVPDTEFGSLLTGLTVRPEAEAVRTGTLLGWLTVPDYAMLRPYDADGTPAGDSRPAATGMEIAALAGDGETLASLRLVVLGDVTGSGILDITQLVRLAQALTGARPLTGVYALAADLNASGRLDIADLVRAAALLTEQTSPSRH